MWNKGTFWIVLISVFALAIGVPYVLDNNNRHARDMAKIYEGCK